jgi:hypothetical protein
MGFVFAQLLLQFRLSRQIKESLAKVRSIEQPVCFKLVLLGKLQNVCFIKFSTLVDERSEPLETKQAHTSINVQIDGTAYTSEKVLKVDVCPERICVTKVDHLYIPLCKQAQKTSCGKVRVAFCRDQQNSCIVAEPSHLVKLRKNSLLLNNNHSVQRGHTKLLC